MGTLRRTELDDAQRKEQARRQSTMDQRNKARPSPSVDKQPPKSEKENTDARD
jgi:hypothetical protein